MRYEPGGIVYEADVRHAELVVETLDLEGGNEVDTPGVNQDRGGKDKHKDLRCWRPNREATKTQ